MSVPPPSETTPLLVSAQRPSDGAEDLPAPATWRFNIIDRPARDVWGTILAVSLLILTLSRTFYFLEFDPLSKPLSPLPFPSLLRRLLLPLLLGTPLAIFGCRLLLTWTKNVCTHRGMRWMLLAFAVFQTLSTLTPLNPEPPYPFPSPPSLSPSHALDSGFSNHSLGYLSSHKHPVAATWQHSLAATWQHPFPSWLQLRHATWQLSQWGPPAIGPELAPVEEPTAGAKEMRVFAVTVALCYSAAAVVVLARCTESLHVLSPIVSGTANLILTRGKPLPGITVAAVSTVTYLTLVLALSLFKLLTDACEHAAFPSFVLFKLLSRATVSSTVHAAEYSEQCDEVYSALVPEDVTGSLFTVLGALVFVWACCLGLCVLRFAACFVLSEASTNQRTETQGRDQWAVVAQGFRLAVRESLGSLCALSLVWALALSLFWGLSGGVGVGFISFKHSSLLLVGLQLALVLLDLLLNSICLPLVAVSGRTLGECLDMGARIMREKFVSLFVFLVCIEAALAVLSVIILLIVTLGTGLVGAFLSMGLVGKDILGFSSLVLDVVPSLSIGIFANVFGTAAWCAFIHHLSGNNSALPHQQILPA